MTAPVYTRHSEGSNTDVTEWVRALEAERDRLRTLADDYLRQAKNHERHLAAGGFLNLAEQTIVDKARAYRAALSASTEEGQR